MRALIAGVPMDDQPTFSLEPFERTDSGGNVPDEVIAQNRRYAEWAASYYGAGLSPALRQRLTKLYLETVDSGAAWSNRAKRDSASVESNRRATSSFFARQSLAERRIFSTTPSAQVRRYGAVLRHPGVEPDSARLRRAFQQMLIHDDPKTQSFHRGTTGRPILGFRALKAVPYNVVTASCHGADTIVTRTIVDETSRGLNLTEARIYLATHQAFPDVTDILKDLGMYSDQMMHTSVVAGLWSLEAVHILTLKYYREAGCNFPIGLPKTARITRLHDLVQTGQPAETIKTTVYQLANDEWSIGNGASGEYDASDNLQLISKASFSSYADAQQWLYKPTPSPSGHYYRMRAAAYSIGDYGWDFICQTSANAFSIRRWNILVVPEPLWDEWFGLYGRQGISHRYDWLHQLHYGCVPGHWCYYNVYPPYGTPYDEWALDGKGYGLDVFFSPVKGWEYTRADFHNASIPFGRITDFVSEVPGWVP